MAFSFSLNGKPVHLDADDKRLTQLPLSRLVRDQGWLGTKEGCAEGDCGACTVLISDVDHEQKPVWRSACSCITFVPQIEQRAVLTVEGLRQSGELHPVQHEMVARGGSQCGYCTPGFCVAMAAEHHDVTRGAQTPLDALRHMDGNLCRCTGYRPIAEALAAALPTPKTLPAPSMAAANGLVDRFVFPTSVAAACAAFAAHEQPTYVAGATELGVLSRKRLTTFGTLISLERIDALKHITIDDTHVTLGGGAVLSDVQRAVSDVLPSLAAMLAVFASRPIRNRATLAGNLVTASPIGDLAPVLLSLDADVVLAKSDGAGGVVFRTVALTEFFVDYRKTVMAPGEILCRVVVRRPSATSRALAVKISKRRELDISAVACGLVIDVDLDGRIHHARIAFGGVDKMPVRLHSIEALLLGQTPSAIADVAAQALRDALTPLSDVRGSANYRRVVAARVLRAFLLNERIDVDTDVRLPVVQQLPAVSDASRQLTHAAALLHVTGEARYVDDNAHPRRMLELWPVCAKGACGKIKRIDTTRALALPGVQAVLTAKDIPGENDVGAIRKDEVLCATDRVQFDGQVVAMVVADSIDVAQRAAQLVVVDVELEPAILTLRDAMARDSFHTDTHRIERGDVDNSLKSAPHRLHGEIDIGGQEHFYLETHAASAELTDDGGVLVNASTQHPSEVQAVVSHVLHLPRSAVVVTSPRMGGGFGGKETQGNAWAAWVALVAWHLKRPARIMLDRDVDMKTSGKRHPFLATFDVGFDDDGRILALSATLISDGGYALDLSESINDRALFHMDNAYHLNNVRLLGRVAKTNVVSHTAFRGFGGPQGMLVIEDILARIAHARSLPPHVVRERNFYDSATQTTPYGQIVDDNRIPRLWHALKERAEFATRQQAVDAFNAQHTDVKRGLGLVPVKFGISFTASFLNQAGALVHIYRDGSVQLNHGGTEMGQGLHTKMIGIAMRELGLSRDRIRLMPTTTDKVPNTSATAASSGADLNGAAILAALTTLKTRLVPVACRLLNLQTADELVFAQDRIYCVQTPQHFITFEALAAQAYMDQVSLSATGYYKTPDIHYNKKLGQGHPFHYFAYGVALAEVELIVATGQKRVLRVDVLHDVGTSLNADIDRGQIEGAFVQGMGWLTSEEVRHDAQGRLLTHSASTVQIPTMFDLPGTFNVMLSCELWGDDTRQDSVVHGSKAVGEPPLMLALSVREALRNAVLAAGGPVALHSPLSHERLCLALSGHNDA